MISVDAICGALVWVGVIALFISTGVLLYQDAHSCYCCLHSGTHFSDEGCPQRKLLLRQRKPCRLHREDVPDL